MVDKAGSERHLPVMAVDVCEMLEPRPAGRYIDATLGDGGLTIAILDASAPGGEVLAVDWDDDALARSKKNLAAYLDRVSFARSSFERIRELLPGHGWGDGADGMILDLGVSTHQITEPGRGFSFQKDGPLDMRMDQRLTETAADLCNTRDEKTLANIIYRYGEERASRRIARTIVERRLREPLETTADLRRAVKDAGVFGRPGHDPATRTFQGLRIAVNDELGTLERFLEDGFKCLRPGGRMAVLSYHSLEDRLVKHAFRKWASDCICPPETPICGCSWRAKVNLIVRRPKRPSAEEVERNPRARSARLRGVQRI